MKNIFLIISLLLLISCSQQLIIKNSIYSMEYSSNWTIIPDHPSNVLDALISNDGSVLINVKQLPVDNPITQEELNQVYENPEFIDEIKMDKNIADITIYDYTLTNTKIKMMQYIETVNIEGKDMQLFTNTYYILTPKETKLIMINYLTYTQEDFYKYSSEAKTIIDSFKWT